MKSSNSKVETASKACDLLEIQYPDAICSLNSANAFELLIATRLSAQCTDARVNIVTPALFEKFPTAQAMANAEVEQVEELIRTCGLYKTKARDLIGTAKGIVERFGGRIPDTIDELITLPGIGRKTANLVCGDVYGKPAIVADTHFIRLCNRMGFLSTKDPMKVENIMRNLLPEDKSNDFCHRSVIHGRQTCTARKAFCERCCLADMCEKNL